VAFVEFVAKTQEDRARLHVAPGVLESREVWVASDPLDVEGDIVEVPGVVLVLLEGFKTRLDPSSASWPSCTVISVQWRRGSLVFSRSAFGKGRVVENTPLPRALFF
jgi:hypothetical protein